MRRLICAFVVRIRHKQVFSWRGSINAMRYVRYRSYVICQWMLTRSQILEFTVAESFEPRHDKTNKMTVRPAKTQIRLGESECSLCAQCVAKDPSFLHADSEDSDQTGRISDQTGRMPRLIWFFAGRTWNCVGFVMRRLISSLFI